MGQTTTVEVSFSVTPLTDNTVWFANAAAWTNYWSTQGFEAIIPVAGVGQYGLVQSATTVAFAAPGVILAMYTSTQLDVAGNGVMTQVDIPQRAVIDALVAELNALATDYVILKAALKNANIISNA